MSNPHSAEVKEDKREWLVIEHNGEMKILTSDSELATKKLMKMYPNCVSRIVPASEKQRLQILLEEAENIIGKLNRKTDIYLSIYKDDKELSKYKDEARKFLGRVRK